MSPTTLGFLTLDAKGRATFPKELRDELGLREHTQLRVDLAPDGTYELVPVELVPVDQLWFHGAEGRSRVARAEDDFLAGRSTRTHGEPETLRHLDALKARGAGHTSPGS